MAECKIKHCDTVVDFNGEMITESAWLNNSVIQAEYVYIGGSSLIRCIYTIYVFTRTVLIFLCVWYFSNSCKLNIWNVIILFYTHNFIFSLFYTLYSYSLKLERKNNLYFILLQSLLCFYFYFICKRWYDVSLIFYLTFILINDLTNNDTVTNKKNKF